MQKMLYIFLSKCSCGKLFSAPRFLYAAGNAHQYWLSAHLPGNNRHFYFFENKVIANQWFGMMNSRVSFQANNRSISNKHESIVIQAA